MMQELPTSQPSNMRVLSGFLLLLCILMATGVLISNALLSLNLRQRTRASTDPASDCEQKAKRAGSRAWDDCVNSGCSPRVDGKCKGDDTDESYKNVERNCKEKNVSLKAYEDAMRSCENGGGNAGEDGNGSNQTPKDTNNPALTKDEETCKNEANKQAAAAYLQCVGSPGQQDAGFRRFCTNPVNDTVKALCEKTPISDPEKDRICEEFHNVSGETWQAVFSACKPGTPINQNEIDRQKIESELQKLVIGKCVDLNNAVCVPKSLVCKESEQPDLKGCNIGLKCCTMHPPTPQDYQDQKMCIEKEKKRLIESVDESQAQTQAEQLCALPPDYVRRTSFLPVNRTGSTHPTPQNAASPLCPASANKCAHLECNVSAGYWEEKIAQCTDTNLSFKTGSQRLASPCDKTKENGNILDCDGAVQTKSYAQYCTKGEGYQLVGGRCFYCHADSVVVSDADLFKKNRGENAYCTESATLPPTLRTWTKEKMVNAITQCIQGTAPFTIEQLRHYIELAPRKDGVKLDAGIPVPEKCGAPANPPPGATFTCPAAHGRCLHLECDTSDWKKVQMNGVCNAAGLSTVIGTKTEYECKKPVYDEMGEKILERGEEGNIWDCSNSGQASSYTAYCAGGEGYHVVAGRCFYCHADSVVVSAADRGEIGYCTDAAALLPKLPAAMKTWSTETIDEAIDLYNKGSITCETLREYMALAPRVYGVQIGPSVEVPSACIQ